MTTKQFRAALAKAGLSQLQFAALVGVNPRTVRRWALGESPVPEWTIINGQPKSIPLILEHHTHDHT